MELNEVMKNEELMETTEEIAKAGAGHGFKTAAGFGFGMLAGIAVCKLAKPIIAHMRARKAAKETVIDVDAKEVTDEEA